MLRLNDQLIFLFIAICVWSSPQMMNSQNHIISYHWGSSKHRLLQSLDLPNLIVPSHLPYKGTGNSKYKGKGGLRKTRKSEVNPKKGSTSKKNGKRKKKQIDSHIPIPIFFLHHTQRPYEIGLYIYNTNKKHILIINVSCACYFLIWQAWVRT